MLRQANLLGVLKTTKERVQKAFSCHCKLFCLAVPVETQRKEGRLERLKRFLRVDSDETEDIHEKYHQTADDVEKRLKRFEEQLNITVNINITPPPKEFCIKCNFDCNAK